MSGFEKVAEFERAIAKFAGAGFGIATDSCSSAIFLACKCLCVDDVLLPARTYISVPAAVIHAGGKVEFEDVEWSGSYQLKPYPLWDAALRFKRGMFTGEFMCLSFQTDKHLGIGKGGMILTDDAQAARWLTKMRSNGRNFSVPYADDQIEELGWNMHMMPEQAERGLERLKTVASDAPDIVNNYPDLRQMPVFQNSRLQKEKP